jgi:hypothetical protein
MCSAGILEAKLSREDLRVPIRVENDILATLRVEEVERVRHLYWIEPLSY